MPLTKITKIPMEVQSRCATLFGASPEELRRIGLSAAAARNEETPLMPPFAGGMLAHIYGVEQLKATFVNKDGWIVGCVGGVDHVISVKRNRKIMFQNVDLAATERFEPQACSVIGEAKRAAVEQEPLRLFPYMQAEDDERRQRDEAFYNAEPWFYCVSYKDGVPSCELSRPRGIEKGGFAKNFVERIFIEIDGESGSLMPEKQENPPTDIKPIVTRK